MCGKFKIIETLAQTIIEAAQRWAALVVFAPKKDRTLRICVDLRKLNTATKSYLYPIHRMDKCVCIIGEETDFITLEAVNRYW